MKKQKHMFTKDEARMLLSLWEDNTKEDIARKLKLGLDQIAYLANQMRKVGFQLSKKHKKGHLRNMLEELKKEIKK